MVKIGAIILAAGMSKRMKQPKLLLQVGGKPLFKYSVEAASSAGLHPIVVIGGEHVDELRNGLKDLPGIEVIRNEKYFTGMASSLKTGIRAMKGRTDATMIFLADQPLVSCKVVEKLIDSYLENRKHGTRIVRPEYQGAYGHPVLIDSELFREFESIEGDQGGKNILVRYSSQLTSVPFGEVNSGLDVDTYEDLLRIKSIMEHYR